MEITNKKISKYGLVLVRVEMQPGEVYSFKSFLPDRNWNPGTALLTKGSVSIFHEEHPTGVQYSSVREAVGSGWLLPGDYRVVADAETTFICVTPWRIEQLTLAAPSHKLKVVYLEPGGSYRVSQGPEALGVICVQGQVHTGFESLNDGEVSEFPEKSRSTLTADRPTWVVLVGEKVNELFQVN